jgi:hypothetical protein
MSSHRNESLDTDQHSESRAGQNGNDRSGALGFLALLGLAFPALGIRYLLPDLNPLLLAGLGLAVYSIYLGMLIHYMAQAEDAESALEPVVLETREQ